MTPALRLAGLAAQELRRAELNEQWRYLVQLLILIEEMGGRVMRVGDPQFSHRADYVVQFRLEDALPGALK